VQVDWQIVSSVARVIISLIYVGREMRHSAKATQASTYIKVNDTMIENTCLLLGPEAAGPVFLKAMNGLGKLEFMDYYRFHMVALGMMRRYETLYVLRSMGLLADWSTEGFKSSLVSLLTHQGVAEWWPTSAYLFSQSFAGFVNELMQQPTEQRARPGHGSVDFAADGARQAEAQPMNTHGSPSL